MKLSHCYASVETDYIVDNSQAKMPTLVWYAEVSCCSSVTLMPRLRLTTLSITIKLSESANPGLMLFNSVAQVFIDFRNKICV